MAVGQGFSKVVTSGSVFHYDTGDMINSFPGKFGTNILAGIIKNYNGAGQETYSNGKLFRWNGYTETVNIPALGNRTVETVEIYNVYSGYGVDGNYNCCPSLFNYSNGWLNTPLSSSTVYMYEIVYKCNSGYTNPNYMYHYEFRADDTYNTEFGVHDESRRISLGDGWYYAWGEFTTQATTAKGYFGLWYYYYNVPDKVSVASISLQQGNSILPPRQIIPTNTTRTTTQSLIDVAGGITVDMTNASFNSTGEISLDGSNDYIKASQNSNFYTNNWTWEMVVKFTANTGTYQGLVWAEGDTGGGSGLQYLLTLYNNAILHYRIYNTNSGWGYTDTANITFDPTKYTHITWQFSNGTTYIYINGVLFHTDTSRGAYSGGTNSPMFIGARNDGAYGAPMMPAVYKHYTRVLTPGEVTQNYNHYKTRFNLP